MMSDSQGDTSRNEVEFSGFPCDQCGHDLAGSMLGGRCPECSAPVHANARSRAIGPLDPEEKFVPLTKAQQVAARGEAGVLGLFLGPLIIVVDAIIGLTGQLPWLSVLGGFLGGAAGIGLGALGAMEGQRYNLPRHQKMGSRSMVVGIIILLIGVARLLFMLIR